MDRIGKGYLVARTVNEHEYARKRRAILEAMQRIIHTKGYVPMAIQDILNELKISSGAFYHYFDSKEAVLEAYVDMICTESGKVLHPVVHDPQRSAIQKLQGFLGTLDHIRSARKAAVIKLQRIWYSDANAVVRQRVDQAIFDQRSQMLTEVVHQGIREGVFTFPYPDRAGEVLMSLLWGMGTALGTFMLTITPQSDASSCIAHIIANVDSCIEAMERVLAAPPNSLKRTDVEVVKEWVAALQAE